MAIYSDTFQSYPVGTTPPFGSLTGGGAGCIISNTPLPDGTIGPYGEDRYLSMTAAALFFTDFTARNSGSLWAEIVWPGFGFYGTLLGFKNSSSSSTGFPTASLRANADGTLTITDYNGNPLGTSSDFSLRPNVWTLIQFNVQFNDVGGHLQVVWDVAVNGNSEWSGSVTTSFSYSAGQWLGTVISGNSTIGLTNLTIDTLTAIGTVPNPGTPVIRVTSQLLEVAIGAQPLSAACPIGAVAMVGVPYTAVIQASGGTLPYSFSMNGPGIASLAALGLSWDPSTGTISGTPTAAGTPSYTVTVTDSATPTPASVMVTCSVPAVSSSIAIACALGTVVIGVPYSSQLVVTDGTAPFAFVLVSGPLPLGLTLNPTTGFITGIPTATGTFPYTVRVTDSNGLTAQTSGCQIVVSPTGGTTPCSTIIPNPALDNSFRLQKAIATMKINTRIPVRGSSK